MRQKCASLYSLVVVRFYCELEIGLGSHLGWVLVVHITRAGTKNSRREQSPADSALSFRFVAFVINSSHVHIRNCPVFCMSLPRLWATLRCSPDASASSVDTAASAANIWRHAASTLKQFIPEHCSHLPDLLKWIESSVTSGTDRVASQCLEFGVACLLVFQQANCTGPAPAVPENPFQPDQDARQVRLEEMNTSLKCIQICFLNCWAQNPDFECLQQPAPASFFRALQARVHGA